MYGWRTLCCMNPLATWMHQNGLDDATVAAKIGRSRVHVSRLRRGINLASIETAKKLEAVTDIPWPEFMDAAQSEAAQ